MMETRGKRLKRNWSDLPNDLLVLIAKHVQVLEDFLAFRGVSVSWRFAAKLENFNESYKFPWLMLKTKVGHFYARRLLNPSTMKTYDLKRIPYESYCLGFKDWLLTVAPNGNMNILHAFSRTKIQLPHISTLKCREGVLFGKVVLSSDPLTTSDYRLVIMYNKGDRLALWKSGDNRFRKTHPKGGSYYRDIAFCDGFLYAINCHYNLVKYNVAGPKSFLEKIASNELPDVDLLHYALVGFDGELFLVSTKTHGVLGLYQFEDNSWKKIDDLGDKAIFLGERGSSILFLDSSKIPGCEANRLYFTEYRNRDYSRRRDSLLLKSREMEFPNIKSHWSTEVESYCLDGPVFWVEPSFFLDH